MPRFRISPGQTGRDIVFSPPIHCSFRSCGPPLVSSPPHRTTEWVHPLARQPAPRAAQIFTMFQSQPQADTHRHCRQRRCLPSNYPSCQSGFHIQSIIWCPLSLHTAPVRKPTTLITHNTLPAKSPHNPTQHRQQGQNPGNEEIGHQSLIGDQTEDSRITETIDITIASIK